MLNSTNLLKDIAPPLIVAAIISFSSTPLVKLFAEKWGAIDMPSDARKIHDHPIPRMGGLAIFIALIIGVLCFADITRQVQGILIGAVVIVIVGIIDDIVPLPAMLKFSVQIVAAVIAVYFGVEIQILSNPNVFSDVPAIQLGAFSAPITVFWIVAITNSVNLIDGLDGLAVGVSIIASVTMLIIGIFVSDPNVVIILAVLTGACLGFMPYNVNPAKIFMGDTGALLLGYILGTVSIIGVFKFYALVSFVVPFIALGLPILDTTFAFMRRILTGHNPMHPDRGHLHHRLLDMGMSQKQAVSVLYAISAVLGALAVIVATTSKLKALIALLSAAVATAVAIILMVSHHKHKLEQAKEEQMRAEEKSAGEGGDENNINDNK